MPPKKPNVCRAFPAGSPVHPQEGDRLESLRTYLILGTGPEDEYDDVAARAAQACDAPLAVVALLDEDRQWFKAHYGTASTGAPRAGSLCARVVATEARLVVPDLAAEDGRNPRDIGLAGLGVRSYAGAPLIGCDGLPLGVLSVMDRVPRTFSRSQLRELDRLAAHVVTLLDARRDDLILGRRAKDGARRLSDPRRLRRALDRGELQPFFQPIVGLAEGELAWLEALLRWVHPRRGVLSPHTFLPAMESTALILPVGRHVLRESLRAFRDLPASIEGLPPEVGLAVNVSMVQLAQPTFPDLVFRELSRFDVPAPALTLEVTETVRALDDRVMLASLRALQSAGVQLSIDDYGSGYSSLLRLLDLPVSSVKLDRGLTQRLPRDRRALAATRATIGMAADLGLLVIAEGIERADQRDVLAELGCGFGQGFLWGSAVTSDELLMMLERHTRQARRDVEVVETAPNTSGPIVLAAPPELPRGTAQPCAGAAPAWAHVVEFYDTSARLAMSVSEFLEPALRGEGGVLIAATRAHCELFASALAARGVDVHAARRAGRYLEIDALALLESVLDHGKPDRELFDASVRPVLDSLFSLHGYTRVYGELVAFLWEAGARQAAVELEDLWNGLAEAGTFSLYCAYPRVLVEQDEAEPLWSVVRHQHTHVVSRDLREIA